LDRGGVGDRECERLERTPGEQERKRESRWDDGEQKTPVAMRERRQSANDYSVSVRRLSIWAAADGACAI